MMTSSKLTRMTIGLAVLASAVVAEVPSAGGPDASYIVQAESAESAASAVEATGGTITHELRVIRSVAARLDDSQLRVLRMNPGIARIWADRSAELTGKGGNGGSESQGGGNGHVVATFYPTHLGADQLHEQGIDGTGVTIAVIDSGAFWDNGLTKDQDNNHRILAHYDAASDESTSSIEDEQGHGSHVTSIAVSSRQTETGSFNGMAPDADLVVVTAFDRYGQGTYADVIRGIDWVVSNRDTYGIRVLNCSFSAEPQSYYWDDPLNQAIMNAWQMGIVVVASAGNRGPDPMTIGAPGNVPYVVTVGAMTDNFTPENFEDDVLATFSSTGPTVEAFVKPEIVAPGGHVRGLMKNTAQIAVDYPEFHDGGYYFNMSGTSQAAAFVSGTVALMLEVDPSLTPDQVKFRLMATANRASFSAGSPTYSVFQQGAGLVDSHEAATSTLTGVANSGLDVDADLLGLQHFRGPADGYKQNGRKGTYTFFIRDADGTPIEDDGYLWDGGYAFQDGFLWDDAFLWDDGFIWNDAFLWDDGFIWNDAFLWDDGFIWNDLYSEALFTESWVPQE
jgi:serine protease AprX